MTVLDDWCTTCRTHRAPIPGGQCPVCAPTDDILDRIDAALTAEDQALAGRHQASDAGGSAIALLPAGYRPRVVLHGQASCFIVPAPPNPAAPTLADLGLTRQENPR